MDAFEQVVSEILWMSGFWVRTSVKVEPTKEEKSLTFLKICCQAASELGFSG